MYLPFVSNKHWFLSARNLSANSIAAHGGLLCSQHVSTWAHFTGIPCNLLDIPSTADDDVPMQFVLAWSREQKHWLLSESVPLPNQPFQSYHYRLFFHPIISKDTQRRKQSDLVLTFPFYHMKMCDKVVCCTVHTMIHNDLPKTSGKAFNRPFLWTSKQQAYSYVNLLLVYLHDLLLLSFRCTKMDRHIHHRRASRMLVIWFSLPLSNLKPILIPMAWRPLQLQSKTKRQWKGAMMSSCSQNEKTKRNLELLKIL